MYNKHILSIIILILIHANIFSQTAGEISDRSLESVDFKAMEMAITLRMYDSKGRVRTRKLHTANKDFGKESKTLIKFTAPADVRGTALLIYDYRDKADKMWIYMPALRKTRRIISGEKGKSFMGSEFSNADMSKPNPNDFNYKIIASEIYKGRSCWKIESRCKSEDIEDENGYSKKISWIDKSSYLCYKIAFYDLSGELHKIQYIGDYKKQSNGKYFAYQMKMVNQQSGRRSSLEVDRFQMGSNMAASKFSPGMLEKL